MPECTYKKMELLESNDRRLAVLLTPDRQVRQSLQFSHQPRKLGSHLTLHREVIQESSKPVIALRINGDPRLILEQDAPSLSEDALLRPEDLMLFQAAREHGFNPELLFIYEDRQAWPLYAMTSATGLVMAVTPIEGL